MLKRFLSRSFVAACAVMALTSCGDSKSKGTAEFTTVFATATPPGSALDSDVTLWFDAATVSTKSPPCGGSSVPTTKPDDQVFTILSTAFPQPNTGSASTITPSDLLITKITLTFTPANSLSPALPAAFQTQFPSAGQRIVVGSNDITVRVVSNELKNFLRNSLGAQSINCSNSATYSYRVSASFEALEVNTNRVATITPAGDLVVNFSDFIDP